PDLYERDDAASMIGWVTMAMVVAPMIAPLIGGVLDASYGWQAIFVFVGLFTAAVLVWTILVLPETRAVATSEGILRFLADTKSLLTDPKFIGYALVSTFNSAMFFTFIGGAPHVVVAIMHRAATEYGVWFVILSLVYMAGNFAAGQRSAKFGVDLMITTGVAVTLLAAGAGA